MEFRYILKYQVPTGEGENENKREKPSYLRLLMLYTLLRRLVYPHHHFPPSLHQEFNQGISKHYF